jgi:hypothetical protein
MDYWLDGFKRDLHPSNEVSHWERVAAVYREYAAMVPLTPDQHQQVVHLIILLRVGNIEDPEVKEKAKGLPDDALEIISKIYNYQTPPYDYDIEEEIGFKDRQWSEDVLNIYRDLDKERFPKDIPDQLVLKLMDPAKSYPAPDHTRKCRENLPPLIPLLF